MVKQANEKMLKGKDLITIGIFSAVYFVTGRQFTVII